MPHGVDAARDLGHVDHPGDDHERQADRLRGGGGVSPTLPAIIPGPPPGSANVSLVFFNKFRH